MTKSPSTFTATPSRALNRKPIFDAVRRMLKRGFRQSEVNSLDQTLDRALNSSQSTKSNTGAEISVQNSVTSVSNKAASPSATAPNPSRIGPDGIALIKRFEGRARLRRDGMVEAYPDPGTGGDPWTIGWGATGPGTVWT